MTEPPEAGALFMAAVSIVPTRRGRYLWAAWWSAPPRVQPFRKPDAAHGGTRTHEEALAEAVRTARRPLTEIDGRWAAAWNRMLRGGVPWPTPRHMPLTATDGSTHPPRTPRTERPAAPAGSRAWAWQLLGLAPGASLAEVTRAFRAAAMRTHPDRGGDTQSFIDVRRAYEIACAAVISPRKPRRSRRGR